MVIIVNYNYAKYKFYALNEVVLLILGRLIDRHLG